MAAPSPESLYGATFACECGKTHTIDPSEVVYAEDAVDRASDVLGRVASGRCAAVLMDARTREAAGAAVSRALAKTGWTVAEAVVPDPKPGEDPRCDDATFERLQAQLGPTDVVLPVGAGVISDLGKWLAWERDLPYAAFATAASMNGYASANIAPTLKGVKSIVYARPPKAVLSSPSVLAAAPHKLTGSGLGDILAKCVSTTDWRLNNLLFGEYYCPRAAALINDLEPLYLDRPEAIRDHEPDALGALFEGLLLTGVAMTMAETSAPSSGGEHLVSHALDMMSTIDGTPHDYHGRQVGIGTVLASAVYERVLAIEAPAFAAPPTEVDRAFWGPLADQVAAEYRDKRDKYDEVPGLLSQADAWDRLREALSGMARPPEATRECLRRAGAAWRAEDIDCTGERLRAAFAHAHEMRSRFTILDLARLVGVLPGAVDELVDAWA